MTEALCRWNLEKQIPRTVSLLHLEEHRVGSKAQRVSGRGADKGARSFTAVWH